MTLNRFRLIPRRSTGRAPALLAAVMAAALAAPAAWAADRSSADAVYQRERAACQTQQTSQSVANCLREAAAAREEARRGRLTTGQTAEQRAANALRRCAVHRDDDARMACERMARGEGKQEGSVAEGAVIKEMVTRSVGAADEPPRKD